MANYKVSHPGFYMFSLLSLAILLVLSGLLMSALFLTDFYARKFKEEIKLLAELQEGAEAGEVTAFLEDYEGIKTRSIAFISREDALAEMYGAMGDDVTIGEIDNPFYDMVEFSIEADAFNLAYVEQLEATMSAELEIRQLHYPNEYFDNVFGLMRSARQYIALFVIVALAMTGVLIHHIMRLNVLAMQTQIRTMELVGARAGFIRRPFIRRALRMAFHGWLIAVVITVLGWLLLSGPGMLVSSMLSVPGFVGVSLLLILSVAICTFSTRLAVNRSLGSSVLQT